MGTITYELLNQLADDKHYSRMSIFKASDTLHIGNSKGYYKFHPHSSLSHDPATNTQYLLDDTLYFRVSVTVDNCKPWLVCTDQINMDSARTIKDNKTLKDGEPILFKITGYNARMATDNWFYSDSFYTSPGGYKMCIEVVPNGKKPCRGTHVSVCARLIEGAYDASLPWPFIGTVTFTLLNQLEDKKHHSWTLQYKPADNAQAGINCGNSQFFSHSSLFYNRATKTQYLIDDTLYFRVSVKVDSHKPWLVCTHHP